MPRGPGQATDTIALVIEDPANPFWSAVTRGVVEIARRHHHALIVGSTGLNFEQERDLLRDLVRRQVDGLLVTPTADDHADLHRELAHRTPMVFIDRAPVGVLTDSVILDNVGGAHQAVSHLLSRGHRRVAYIGGDPAVGTGASRRTGYRRALEDAGLSYDPALVSLNVHSVSGARNAAARLLTGPAPATAIFADNNRMCLGVLKIVARREPGVDVAGFDDVELADLLPRPVAMVTYDGVELGRQAAELLFRRIRGSTEPVTQVLLPTTLRLRGGR